MCTTDTCAACCCREDLHHAFLTCKMNTTFFKKLIDLVKDVYNVKLKLDAFFLLKIQDQKDIDDILTIAFWSIYKMLILRNETGNDKREKNLWYTFLHELKTRMVTNNTLIKMGKKSLYNLPECINMYI